MNASPPLLVAPHNHDPAAGYHGPLLHRNKKGVDQDRRATFVACPPSMQVSWKWESVIVCGPGCGSGAGEPGDPGTLSGSRVACSRSAAVGPARSSLKP